MIQNLRDMLKCRPWDLLFWMQLTDYYNIIPHDFLISREKQSDDHGEITSHSRIQPGTPGIQI